jgi:cell wall-associated NlpC family hydrolase
MAGYTLKKQRPYRGLSLMYVREVLGKRGPRFPTCSAFMDHYKDRLTKTNIEVGMIVFFAGTTYGDIGIYVGDGLVLGHPGSSPQIYPLALRSEVLVGAMHWPDEDRDKGV